MKFATVSLVSHRERRALKVKLSPQVTVIQAGNGFGKSALMKSLYNTFGAEPHRIDDPWKAAEVTSSVDFDIDGEPFTIVKFAKTYAVFDGRQRKLFQTSSVTNELGPYLAKLLNFKLLMANRADEVIVPPPSYAFAPYYVDQDKSWGSAWESFKDLYLPNSSTVLADYHSGLRPNDYYVALAERTQVMSEKADASTYRVGISNAVEHLQTLDRTPEIFLTLDDFKAETTILLDRARRLLTQQEHHRTALAELSEIRSMWRAQSDIARIGLQEADAAFVTAHKHDAEIDCPMCGAHYTNGIVDRFKISADKQALATALIFANHRHDEIDDKISKTKNDLSQVSAALTETREVLNARRADISLEDVVRAEGRNLATRALREKIREADEKIGGLDVRAGQLSTAMKQATDRNRTTQIKNSFEAFLQTYAGMLDVRTGDKSRSIAAAHTARGSEGPRGLAAYYYAFLRVTHDFGSAAFCPIVIDAPNQQGQDAKHLPAMIAFLVRNRPKDSQLILAVEDAVGIQADEATIISVGVTKNRLMSEEMFDSVSKEMQPLIDQMLLN